MRKNISLSQVQYKYQQDEKKIFVNVKMFKMIADCIRLIIII